ncbi:MAG: 50S ribosomal protein L15 [Spirochaetota bacterium]|nr:50S ribosomal protein L15 [Spirochaetota bacterium]
MDFVLKPDKGAKKKRKRVGRGSGSGHGKTSTRGHKGQRSRSGGKGSPYMGFEGGQMPLYRRTPKRGFTNIFKKEIDVINLTRLDNFNDGDEITIDLLKEKGLVRKNSKMVKLLGNGDLKKKLTIRLNEISKSAQEKVEKSGSTFEAIK